MDWVTATVLKVFVRPRRRRYKHRVMYPQLSIVPREFYPTMFAIGGSIIARWRPSSLLHDVRIMGVEGLDSSTLLMNAQRILPFLLCDDILLCYCGSNDFFDGRRVQDTMSRLISFFTNCHCHIVYINVIKSPVMRHMATPKVLDAFNLAIHTLLTGKRMTSFCISVDDDMQRADFVLDGIHLSESGYAKFEHQIAKKTEEIRRSSFIY